MIHNYCRILNLVIGWLSASIKTYSHNKRGASGVGTAAESASWTENLFRWCAREVGWNRNSWDQMKHAEVRHGNDQEVLSMCDLKAVQKCLFKILGLFDVHVPILACRRSKILRGLQEQCKSMLFTSINAYGKSSSFWFLTASYKSYIMSYYGNFRNYQRNRVLRAMRRIIQRNNLSKSRKHLFPWSQSTR